MVVGLSTTAMSRHNAVMMVQRKDHYTISAAESKITISVVVTRANAGLLTPE